MNFTKTQETIALLVVIFTLALIFFLPVIKDAEASSVNTGDWTITHFQVIEQGGHYLAFRLFTDGTVEVNILGFYDTSRAGEFFHQRDDGKQQGWFIIDNTDSKSSEYFDKMTGQ